MIIFNKKNPHKKHRTSKYRDTGERLKPQHKPIISLKNIIVLVLLIIGFGLSYLLVNYFYQHQAIKPQKIIWQTSNVLPNAALISLKKQIQPMFKGSYLHIDLLKIRRLLERSPWIESASIQREFWLKLRIKLQVRSIALRLNDDSYIDTQGKSFLPKYLLNNNAPLAIGTAQQSEKIYQYYQQFNKILSQTLPISAIKHQQTTSVIIGNNTLIELGYDKQAQRLKTFVKLYPRLIKKHKTLDHLSIDMRYIDGLVIKRP